MTMKPKFRAVLEMAIEEGVRYGYQRAFKHNPEPHIDSITDTIVTEIFNSLDTWFDDINDTEN
jgi:hypothetical protein